MTLRIGDTAPDFTAETTQGTVSFHEWLGDSWGLLFSHPADFTPVCTTELGAVAKLKDEWAARGVKPIGLSVDPVEKHREWEGDIADVVSAPVDFPMIADSDRAVAEKYDMIHPAADATATVRSVFIIDPAKKVRLILTYPMQVGRNFDEILRAIDSLQLVSKHPVSTPADWKQGDDVIIALSVDDDAAKERFGDFTAVKPYLRTTPQPA